MPDTQTLQRMTARFAPTEISADLSKLSDADRRVLAKLVEASKIIDALFLRQVWAGNDAMLLDLARDQSPEGRARLHYFLINKGPWSRLDHNQPFVPGAPAKPAGANFYPDGASKAELEQLDPVAARSRARARDRLLHRHPPRAAARSRWCRTTSSIRASWRAPPALLREAAALATEPTLKAFLTKRADAFLSNDYYDSDVAWMELKGAIEPTIGPYEVYEDEWFNYKAGVRGVHHRAGRGRDARSCRGSPASCRTSRTTCRSIRSTATRSSARLAPIVVVNEIFAAGDANRGVQTAAFNLPNDERVVREKGAKRVMLKNVQDAKFAKTLVPISKVVLSPADQKDAVLRRVLHAHRRARADARPRPAQHHRRTAGRRRCGRR